MDPNTTTIVRSNNTDYQQHVAYIEMKAFESVTADYMSDVGIPALCVIVILYLSYKWISGIMTILKNYSSYEQRKSERILNQNEKMLDHIINENKEQKK